MSLSIKMDLPTDAELAKMFDAVSLLRRHDVMRTTTKAGGRVVEVRAKAIAPRGTEADRNKRSAKQKAAADWNTRLHTTIGMVTRGGNRRSFTIIGPRYPKGNKAYLNSPKSGERRHVLWGRDTGRIKVSIRNWIVQAFDETRGEQLSQMKGALTKKVDEMMRSG